MSVHFCLFRYRLSPEIFGYAHVYGFEWGDAEGSGRGVYFNVKSLSRTATNLHKYSENGTRDLPNTMHVYQLFDHCSKTRKTLVDGRNFSQSQMCNLCRSVVS